MTGKDYTRAVLIGAALVLWSPGAGHAQSPTTILHLLDKGEHRAAVGGADGTFQVAKFKDLHAIFETPDGAPAINLLAGGLFRITLEDGRLGVAAASSIRQQKGPPGALPDGERGWPADTGKGVRTAWFDQPTTRYGHAVLGDGIEAGGLAVEYADGTTKSLTLPPDRVFEDRVVRFTNYFHNGRHTLMTVTSYLNAGAALTLVDTGEAGGPAPRVLAEARPIGTPNRWLNPVGAGDVDGDGRIEFLAVITPHIGGTLTAYEHREGRLVAEHELDGFSNHAYGSRELAFSGLADLDSPADGVPEAIVPDAERRSMTVVRFTDAGTRIVSRLTLARGRISHRLVIRDLDGDGVPELTFGTDDGSVVVWSPGIAR